MGKIIYKEINAKNAFKCLMIMQRYENFDNFGELKCDYPKTNRYTLEYNNDIDSTFYTDKATSILAYAISLYSTDIESDFAKEIYELSWLYSNGLNFDYDFINDSKGEYANFNGDLSILESGLLSLDRLYAYYSEFQTLSEDEEKKIFKRLYLSEYPDFRIAIKKTTTINGVDTDFYYLTSTYYDLGREIYEHDLKAKYLEDRFSESVLTAINNSRRSNDIIIASRDFSYSDPNFAAFAEYRYGSIVVKEGYFEDSICHEMGHMFDRTNDSLFEQLSSGPDYNAFNFGKWDLLAKKYSDDIATIRKGADISCGYDADKMRDKHSEFYAESFQLYFYSPETRAALPEEVRNTLEKELSKYAGEQIGG